MKNEKRRVIMQLIKRLIAYEGDEMCLSDLVVGDPNGLRFHLGIIKKDPEFSIHYTNKSGYVHVIATADMVDPKTPLSDITFDGFPHGIALYHWNDKPTRNFDDIHIGIAKRMFEHYDPNKIIFASKTDASEWTTKPVTRIVCDEPRIDATLDGHLTLRELADDPALACHLIPNGPSAVTISHEAVMVRVEDAAPEPLPNDAPSTPSRVNEESLEWCGYQSVHTKHNVSITIEGEKTYYVARNGSEFLGRAGTPEDAKALCEAEYEKSRRGSMAEEHIKAMGDNR